METIEQLKQQIEQLQNQVKQQEKLASLGMLTAGIMHEIRNPLNFVVNFSKMTESLLNDLSDVIDENKEEMSEEAVEEANEIMDDAHENLKRIKEHGDRATSIIQNILLYSRGKEDERIPTDVCKLVKEYVWLSYHAMRANYKNFNIAIRENYDTTLPVQQLISQDISRAVLNIMNNACYAVWSKAQQSGDDYHPEVEVSVGKQGNEFFITVTDNGTGMSEEVKEKLFETFFTTKPVGHGTGLGMSITLNIVKEKHNGRIEFDSKEGEYTTFSLIMPLTK